MALDNSRLAAAIADRLDTLFSDHESPPARADIWIAIAEEIVDEIVQNLAVKGVRVETNATHQAAWAGVPVPTDGGAALKTAALAAAAAPMPATQSNDGTGLVE